MDDTPEGVTPTPPSVEAKERLHASQAKRLSKIVRDLARTTSDDPAVWNLKVKKHMENFLNVAHSGQMDAAQWEELVAYAQRLLDAEMAVRT